MNLVERVKGILLAPDSEWRTIAAEPDDATGLFANYVAYLAAVPAICGFIGTSIIGFTIPTYGTFRVDVLSGLMAAIFQFLLAFVVVYVVALIIDALAPTFSGTKNLPNALKLAAYSYTPAWLAGVFLLVPGLRFLTILGLYGLYLLYKGLPVLMRSPPDKSFIYAAAVVACAIIIGLIVGAIEASLFALPGIV